MLSALKISMEAKLVSNSPRYLFFCIPTVGITDSATMPCKENLFLVGDQLFTITISLRSTLEMIL